MASPDRFYHLSDRLNTGDFVKIPMSIIESEDYQSLDATALYLYGLLERRMNLSLINHWHDENGRVYFYYTKEQIADDLRVSLSTAARTVQKLIDVGLLEKVRQGKSKPNRLYLLKPDLNLLEEMFPDEGGENPSPSMCPPSNNCPSRHTLPSEEQLNLNCHENEGQLNLTCQDDSFLHPKKIENKKIELKNTLYSSSSSTERREKEDEVKEKIEYQTLKDTQDVKTIDYIIDIVVDVLTSKSDTLRIGKRKIDMSKLRVTVSNIDKDTVLHVVAALQNAENVMNHRNYILTVLSNYCKVNKAVVKKPKNSFHDFDQRTYDDDFYKKIMGVQGL